MNCEFLMRSRPPQVAIVAEDMELLASSRQALLRSGYDVVHCSDIRLLSELLERRDVDDPDGGVDLVLCDARLLREAVATKLEAPGGCTPPMPFVLINDAACPETENFGERFNIAGSVSGFDVAAQLSLVRGILPLTG